MDKNKLIKFLNLSASQNDGEALASIRKANTFLLENKLNWDELIIENPQNKKVIIYSEHLSSKVDDMLNKMYNGAERGYSIELEENIRGFKNLISYLAIVIVILICIVLFLIWG